MLRERWFPLAFYGVGVGGGVVVCEVDCKVSDWLIVFRSRQ